MRSFTFADLCAGVGGFRLALSELGGVCRFSADIDKECEKTYSSNFKDVFNAYDVHSINPSTFPKVDILTAGFPCQPFSIAGKRNAFNDPRGQVFFKLAEIIEASLPRAILLENVPNLLTIDKGKTIKTIVKTLDELGYATSVKLLDSSKFGVPQARKRLYIVAILKEISPLPITLTESRTKSVSLRSFMNNHDHSIPISKKWNSYIDLYTGNLDLDDIDFDVPKTRAKLERAEKDVDLNDCIFQIRSSGIRAISLDKPFPTFAVSVSGGGAMIPVYSKERRHLNLIEMKRIMGFPDDFNFPVSRTNAIKQLSNAVCPPVIKSIGKDILSVIKEHSICD